MREAAGVGYLAAGVTLIATSAGPMLGGRFVLPATGLGVSSILVYAAGGLRTVRIKHQVDGET